MFLFYSKTVLNGIAGVYYGGMNVVSFDTASKMLAGGAVGVLPTDTVYGLVTSATRPDSVARFYQLKNRQSKPGTLIASSVNQLIGMGFLQYELDQVRGYWPNSLSAVLTLTANDYLTQGVGSLAVRVVSTPNLKTLLRQTGPLITSSANRPGEPIATSLDEAYAYFGDAVDFYVDGGEIAEAHASTIVRVAPDGLEIIRQGSVIP